MASSNPGRALLYYCLIRDALLADRELRRILALRELLVTVAWEWSQGRAMTIKHCILTYAGAEKLVRKHIRALMDAGYIETFRSERDGRERLLRPTALTLERLRRIEDFLEREKTAEPASTTGDSEGIGYEPPVHVPSEATELEP